MFHNLTRRNLVIYDIRESPKHFGGVLLVRVSDYRDYRGGFVILEKRSCKHESVLGSRVDQGFGHHLQFFRDIVHDFLPAHSTQ